MDNYSSPYSKKGNIVRFVYLLFSIFYYIYIKLNNSKKVCVILCYHSVGERYKKEFYKQMEYVRKYVAPISECLQPVIIESSPRVSITFDDAFRDILVNALPALIELRIPATIFVVTNNYQETPRWLVKSGHPDELNMVMSKNEVTYLSSIEGITIGSHSANHYPLADLEEEQAVNEMSSSKQAIENMLGVRCQYLAFPHGSYNHNIINKALSIGYRSVLSLDGISDPNRWPVGCMGRFNVSPGMWFIEFILTVHGGYSWLYGFRGILKKFRRKFNGKYKA